MLFQGVRAAAVAIVPLCQAAQVFLGTGPAALGKRGPCVRSLCWPLGAAPCSHWEMLFLPLPMRSIEVQPVPVPAQLLSSSVMDSVMVSSMLGMMLTLGLKPGCSGPLRTITSGAVVLARAWQGWCGQGVGWGRGWPASPWGCSTGSPGTRSQDPRQQAGPRPWGQT